MDVESRRRRRPRTALALGDAALAASLTDGVTPMTPFHDHALSACRAVPAEAVGEYEQAATLYAQAVERWHRFGSVPERACALLGRGGCLHALGDPKTRSPLREARELFASLGYRPALAETETLLGEAEATAV